MDTIEPSLLSEVEEVLKRRFSKEEQDKAVHRLPSDARAGGQSKRVEQLVLPDEMRPRLPETKDKYLVRENPHDVAWEREVRKFLRGLNSDFGHRVSAVMVYEWATGIKVKELQENGGSASPDLRRINKILRHYFGKPYMTYIMGKKVPNCYRVRPGTYIVRRRPMTLELYSEWQEGTLNP